MNQDVIAARAAVSRRRALGLGGSIGLGALIAACVPGSSSTSPTTSTTGASPALSDVSTDGLIAKLDAIGQCGLQTEDATQGPYWFDVDTIRSDIREDRPGATLTLALRVQDAACEPVPNAVVEIWHCDAGGEYSGFEVASSGGPGASGGGPGSPPGSGGGSAPGDSASGDVSDGSYSEGVSEATPTDDGTYLRGAQVADANGLVRFTTIWPGWYRGRTVHVHLKVHVDKTNILTGQIGFEDDLNEQVYATSPYDEHTGRDTSNAQDSILDASMIARAEQLSDGTWLSYHNLGVAV